MNTALSPKISGTVDWIIARIREDKLVAGDRLPSVRAIAARAGASQMTAWMALRMLQEQGIVSAAPRSHFVVARIPDARSADGDHGTTQDLRALSEARAAQTGPLWRTTHDRIEREVLDGLFTPGNDLPSIKEMQARYEVSYSSLKRALDELAAEKLLARAGRGYRVSKIAVGSGYRTVVFIGPSIDASGLSLSIAGETFIRAMEADCAMTRIHFVKYRLSRSDELDPSSAFPKIPADDDVIGFVVLYVRPIDEFDDDLQRLVSLGKPVFVIDEMGQWQESGSHANVRVFRPGFDDREALQVARFLMQRGHQRVAFFTTYKESDWSRKRLDGLRRIYRGDRLKTYCLDVPESMREAVRCIPGSCDTDSLAAAVATWEARQAPQFGRQLRRALVQYHSEYYALYPCVQYLALEQSFRDALADRSITAWVGANDAIALCALDFLSSENVRTPQRVSVAGFDDTAEALRRDLTSFNFNYAAVAHNAFRFLLNHGARRFRNIASIEVEGYIVERASVGRVKGADRALSGG